MLTGIECAGLVLAVVPLIISAAEHWKEGYEPLRPVIHAKVRDEKLEEFYQDLHTEATFLRLTLEKLVDDLTSLTQAEKETLVDGSDFSLWTAAKVSDALDRRLGRALDAFSDTLRAILRLFDHVVKDDSVKLSQIPSAQQRPIYSKLEALRIDMAKGKKTSTLVGRIRFSAKENKRLSLLSCITKYNKRLERLLNNARPSQTRSKEQMKSTSRLSPSFRASATLLYEALHFHWACQVHTQHAASLCLSCCSNAKQVRGARGQIFDFLFTVEREGLTSPVLCHEGQIQVSSDEEVDCIQPARSIGVTFSLQKPAGVTPAQRRKIKSICEDLLKAKQNNCRLCMVLDGKDLWHLQPQKPSFPGIEAERSMSLKKFLLTAGKLSLREKRILAVVLANALLHLCESPWLQRSWSAEHIRIYPTAPKDPVGFRRVYISSHIQQTGSKDSNSDQTIHPHLGILAMGILLLELHLGQPIESQRCQDDLTDGHTVNANTDLTTAMRVLEESVGEMYEGYRDSVEACLKCDFVPPRHNLSLDDDKTRQAVYEKVVLPLEQELYNGFKITPEDLSPK